MMLKNKLDKDVDQAWESLCQRLEEDRLLLSETDSGQPPIYRRKTLMWAASVAVLITALITFFLLRQEEAVTDGMLVLSNGQDQPTLVTTLRDGSTIYLAGETTIEYPSRFATDKREVALEGSAFFEISRDAVCPFIIDTKQAVVEVLGTSFSIETTGEIPFALSVRNGEVRVTSKLTGETMRVEAGQTALIHSGKLETIATTDRARFKEFLDRVYFKDQTLANVLRIMNEKHSGSPEITCSPELAGRKFNVAFSNESPEEIAEIICVGLGLKYTCTAGAVYITQSD